jgi:hypothetical protein
MKGKITAADVEEIPLARSCPPQAGNITDFGKKTPLFPVRMVLALLNA